MNVISCNQSFKIIKLSDSNFAALVIQTACCPPSKLLNEISAELLSNKINGIVIIDCLLYCGNNQDRFISAYYDNGFDFNSFKYENIKRESYLRKLTSNYLRENNDLVEFSILNSYQKKLLIFGCNI